MVHVLLFGEPLLQHDLINVRLALTSHTKMSLGGTEVRTSLALAEMGNRPCLITTLPDNIIGTEFREILREKHVNTRHIHMSQNMQIGATFTKK